MSGGVLVEQRAHRGLWIGLQAACLLAFVGYRIAAAASYPPAVWQDSEAYKAVAGNGLFSAKLWAGARAPLVPVLMKLAGSYDAYGVVQGVVGGLAWALLAYTAGRLVATSWRKVAVTAIVLGFAASPLVVMWDGSALSESLSLSVLALLWASGIWLVRRFTRPRLAALGVTAAIYCALRDADIWTVGAVGVVVLGLGVAAVLQGIGVDRRGATVRLRENWARARRPATVGAVLLVVALVTGAAASSSHRNLVNVEEAFAVRIFPYAPRVAWFSSQGMPQAAAVDKLAVATKPAPGTAPVVAPVLTDPQWAPLRVWFARDGLTTYALFLALHPGYVLSAPFASPRLTYNDANGDIAFYRPSGYPLALVLGDLFTPNRFVELGMGLAAVVVAVARGVWRTRVWRFTALFAVLGLWSMLLAWHGEGMEVTRHMVEGNVEVRLGVLLALLLALLVTRPSVHPVPPPTPAP